MFTLFVTITIDDITDIGSEAEYRACQEERLCHIVEQPICHIIDMDDLVRYKGNAAHDEQHCTGVTRDFEMCVFHNIRLFLFFARTEGLRLFVRCRILHEGCFTCCAKDGGDDVPENLENCFYCLVHNRCVLNVNK